MANFVAEIPPRLREEVQRFIEAGLHRDLDGLVADALQRYLDTHSDVLIEPFIKEDIEWGLRGQE